MMQGFIECLHCRWQTGMSCCSEHQSRNFTNPLYVHSIKYYTYGDKKQLLNKLVCSFV